VQPDPSAFRTLSERLHSGELVAIPTETVYGLAAAADDAEACAKIFQLKGRPLLDPLIVHVPDLAAAERIAVFNDAARLVASRFWPGPLTIVLPKRASIPAIVTAGLDTVAVRCPGHPVFRAFANFVQRPLAAPSANPFGYISPSRAEHVRDSFPQAGLPILDGGPCEIGLESTIVDLSSPEVPRYLRAGQITRETLAEVLGRPVAVPDGGQSDKATALPAPGMLSRHYSPRTPTRMFTHGQAPAPMASVARVYFQRPLGIREEGDFWLSENGCPEIAGRGLYALLRRLDEDPKWARIDIESPPESVNTVALIDRLRRASDPD